MFLGTVGIYQIFIKDFAKLAKPLNQLLQKDAPFIWEQDQVDSMKNLKDILENVVPLENIDYKNDGVVVLAVDTL